MHALRARSLACIEANLVALRASRHCIAVSRRLLNQHFTLSGGSRPIEYTVPDCPECGRQMATVLRYRADQRRPYYAYECMPCVAKATQPPSGDEAYGAQAAGA